MVETTRAARRSRPPKDGWARRGGATGRRGLAGAVIIICAVVAVLAVADHLMNAGEIRRGVSVGEIALGGKTVEEARTILENSAVGSEGEIRLDGPGGGLTVPVEQLGARLDAVATAERAYAVGRSGGLTDRLSGRIRAAFGLGVPALVSYSPDVARARVEGLAGRVEEEPRDASVEVSGSGVSVTESAKGYRLDVPATARALNAAVEDLSGRAKMVGAATEPEVTTAEARRTADEARVALSGPVTLSADGEQWTLSPQEVGSALTFSRNEGALEVGVDGGRLEGLMAEAYAALEADPVEAGYDVVGWGATAGAPPKVTVTPAREGQRIEAEKLLSAMENGLFVGKREYEVPVATAEPGLTTAEARGMRPAELLGSYRTDYSIVPDSGARMENLSISSEAITGTLLAPGETFSMNDTVSGLDYNATKVIVSGQETLADGGGLCQVTSTLYNAVNEAGLDVTERSPHYAQLPYIRPGLDATVWFGDAQGGGELDMKFENTSEGYVLLRQYVADDGYIYAEVYGTPDDVEVRTWSEPVYRNADSARWITYQTYKEGDKVVYDGELHRDTYEALKDKKGKPIPADTVPVAPVDP